MHISDVPSQMTACPLFYKHKVRKQGDQWVCECGYSVQTRREHDPFDDLVESGGLPEAQALRATAESGQERCMHIIDEDTGECRLCFETVDRGQ